jgi:hypothetical protein
MKPPIPSGLIRTTPRQDWPQILAAIESKFPGRVPRRVPVRRIGEPLMCLANVTAHIVTNQGRPVHGRIVWTSEDASGEVYFVDLEHHVVWESPDGEWFDVTPHNGETEILFIQTDEPMDPVLASPAIIICTSERADVQKATKDVVGIGAAIYAMKAFQLGKGPKPPAGKMKAAIKAGQKAETALARIQQDANLAAALRMPRF